MSRLPIIRAANLNKDAGTGIRRAGFPKAAPKRRKAQS